MKSTNDTGKQLFESIPPCLESAEVLSLMNDLKTLSIYNDTIVQDYNQRICSPDSSKKSSSTSSSNSQLDYIKNKIGTYQSNLYGAKDITARYTVDEMDPSTESGNQRAMIRTYAEHIDTNNCMTGSWDGEWIIEFLTEKTCNVTATVNIHLYYYERGVNIQTRITRTIPTTTVATREEKVNTMVHLFEKEKMSYEEQLSNAIVMKYITQREESLYSTVYDSIFQSTTLTSSLRTVRRILPITKTRFKWDTAAQKQVQLLNEKTK
jgi:hypothetical protein